MESQTMKFIVTVCLGGGDGGDDQVEVEVTDGEIENMKDLVREQGGDEDYFPEYCPSLYEKIRAEIAGEEDQDVFYKVQVPDSVYEMVEAEE